MKKVLVAGTTGYFGQYIVKEFKKQGYWIRALARKSDKLESLKGIQAKLRFTGELKASGLNYLVVNPDGFFSDMLEYLQMAKKGKGYVFGSGDYKINPIHR